MPLNTHSDVLPVVNHKQRISELDLLRGFALFGIFLMNIIAMAYPIEAYINPYALTVSDLAYSGDVTWFDGKTLNNILFSLTHVLIDQKMMGLFSLLFGASTMLFLSTLKEKGQSSAYYFKRNGWLILFGLLHGLFLYIGDVLFVYGICAFALYWFAALRAKWQFILGLIIYSLPIMQQGLMQLAISGFSTDQLQQLQEIWQPSISVLQETVEYVRYDGYWEWVLTTIDWYSSSEEPSQIYDWYWNAVLIEGFLRAFGMMLIGMSFFTWGILPNRDKRKSIVFYQTLFVLGLMIGSVFIALGLWLNFSNEWQASYSAVGGRLLNHIGTPFVVCAYLAMLILWSNKVSNSYVIQALKGSLQAVGRMAFTNYIMQSVFGLFLFTGIGFSLYGQLNRLELMMVVLVICLFQLWFSGFWLQRFRYGPLEWLWRSLTYAKLMKLSN